MIAIYSETCDRTHACCDEIQYFKPLAFKVKQFDILTNTWPLLIVQIKWC